VPQLRQLIRSRPRFGPAVCETPSHSSCQETAGGVLRPRQLRRLALPGPAVTLPDSCTQPPRAPQERARAAGHAAAGRAGPARLLAALWRAFGGPFLRLGGLKLCNDALNFAGARPTVFMPGPRQSRAAVQGRRRAPMLHACPSWSSYRPAVALAHAAFPGQAPSIQRPDWSPVGPRPLLIHARCAPRAPAPQRAAAAPGRRVRRRAPRPPRPRAGRACVAARAGQRGVRVLVRGAAGPHVGRQGARPASRRPWAAHPLLPCSR